jgi:flagellin-like hook-associated protein FlgL
MVVEIDRIAGTTTWAGADLMEDTTTTFSFQVGAATGAKNQISVSLSQMTAEGLAISDGTDST